MGSPKKTLTYACNLLKNQSGFLTALLAGLGTLFKTFGTIVGTVGTVAGLGSSMRPSAGRARSKDLGYELIMQQEAGKKDVAYLTEQRKLEEAKLKLMKEINPGGFQRGTTPGPFIQTVSKKEGTITASIILAVGVGTFLLFKKRH